MSAQLVITIDGPAGTGKSTVAFHLAQRLGVPFLDTGAMYRAVALAVVRRGISPRDRDAVEGLAGQLRVEVDLKAIPPHVYLDGEDVTAAVRVDEVTSCVSPVAVHPRVRSLMVDLQRQWARAAGSLVTEGRDQGSVVFPDADVRFYLDAPADIRASRRLAQMQVGSTTASPLSPGQREVLASLLERDRIDSTREDGPLVVPSGAIIVETGDKTLEQVVDVLESHIRSHAGAFRESW